MSRSRSWCRSRSRCSNDRSGCGSQSGGRSRSRCSNDGSRGLRSGDDGRGDGGVRTTTAGGARVVSRKPVGKTTEVEDVAAHHRAHHLAVFEVLHAFGRGRRSVHQGARGASKGIPPRWCTATPAPSSSHSREVPQLPPRSVPLPRTQCQGEGEGQTSEHGVDWSASGDVPTTEREPARAREKGSV
jgi:hypothetical protein